VRFTPPRPVASALVRDVGAAVVSVLLATWALGALKACGATAARRAVRLLELPSRADRGATASDLGLSYGGRGREIDPDAPDLDSSSTRLDFMSPLDKICLLYRRAGAASLSRAASHGGFSYAGTRAPPRFCRSVLCSSWLFTREQVLRAWARRALASVIEEAGDFLFSRLKMRKERCAEGCLRWRGMPCSNVNSRGSGVCGPRSRLATFAPGSGCSLGVHALHFVIDNAPADATI
jgi:hypothetical protein